MKKIKKLVSLLAAFALLLVLPGSASLTAQAAAPVTYYVKYVSGDSQWRYQVGSVWDTTAAHRELYYMLQSIKDGDLLVIEGLNDDLNLDVGVHLSNLTINHASTVVVTTTGIDSCYVLADSVCAINGAVTNAYVYGNARCTFNNDVTNMEIIGESGLLATVSTPAVVSHLKGSDPIYTYYELYSFAAGKLYIENGTVKTDAAYYSTTAPAAASTASTQTDSTTAASTQTGSTASASTAASNEYDDVPKTGDSASYLWLLGVAALCLLGGYRLNRR